MPQKRRLTRKPDGCMVRDQDRKNHMLARARVDVEEVERIILGVG